MFLSLMTRLQLVSDSSRRTASVRRPHGKGMYLTGGGVSTAAADPLSPIEQDSSSSKIIGASQSLANMSMTHILPSHTSGSSSTHCQQCDHLTSIIKRLTLENEALVFQLGFKDIAMKKREEMIAFLSKDYKLSKDQIRNLEQRKRSTSSDTEESTSHSTIKQSPSFKFTTSKPISHQTGTAAPQSSRIHQSILGQLNTTHQQQSVSPGKMRASGVEHPTTSSFHIPAAQANPSYSKQNRESILNNFSTAIERGSSRGKLINFQDASQKSQLLTSRQTKDENKLQLLLIPTTHQPQKQSTQSEQNSPEQNPVRSSIKKRPTALVPVKSSILATTNENQAGFQQDQILNSQQPNSAQLSSTSRQSILLRSVSRGNISPMRKQSMSPIKLKRKFFDEEPAIQIYKSLPQLKAMRLSTDRRFLEELMNSPEDFADNIVREPFVTRSRVAEEVQRLLRDYIKVLDQSIVLRKAMNSVSLIYRCFKQQEAIITLASEIQGNIECDMCIVFIKDKFDSSLWTTNPSDSNQMVKLELKTGILMHTINSEQILRVEDVQSDPRFDRPTDGKFCKNPKNMTCIPLKDKNKAVRGVVQLINFNRNNSSVSDDEILKLIIDNAGQQIVSIIDFEQASNNNHRILNLMKKTKELYALKSRTEIIHCAKKLLTSVFLSPMAEAYLVRDNMIEVTREETYPISTGVIGQALLSRTTIEMLDHHGSPNVNFKLDIETTLPTISVPIIAKDDSKSLLAVFQIVQDATIRSNALPREQNFFFESLTFFADLLSYLLNRHPINSRTTPEVELQINE